MNQIFKTAFDKTKLIKKKGLDQTQKKISVRDLKYQTKHGFEKKIKDNMFQVQTNMHRVSPSALYMIKLTNPLFTIQNQAVKQIHSLTYFQFSEMSVVPLIHKALFSLFQNMLQLQYSQFFQRQNMTMPSGKSIENVIAQMKKQDDGFNLYLMLQNLKYSSIYKSSASAKNELYNQQKKKLLFPIFQKIYQCYKKFQYLPSPPLAYSQEKQKIVGVATPFYMLITNPNCGKGLTVYQLEGLMDRKISNYLQQTKKYPSNLLNITNAFRSALRREQQIAEKAAQEKQFNNIFLSSDAQLQVLTHQLQNDPKDIFLQALKNQSEFLE